MLAGLVGAAAESSDDEEDDYDEIGEDSDSDEDGERRNCPGPLQLVAIASMSAIFVRGHSCP